MNPISLLGIAAFIIAIASLVLAVRYSRKQQERLSDIAKIDQMSNENFNLYLKDVLESGGYEVEYVDPSQSFGPLLLANIKEDKVLIKPAIFYDRVDRRFLEVMPLAKKHFNADEMLVATNSYFKRAARTYALENNIALFNRDELSQLTRN